MMNPTPSNRPLVPTIVTLTRSDEIHGVQRDSSRTNPSISV